MAIYERAALIARIKATEALRAPVPISQRIHFDTA